MISVSIPSKFVHADTLGAWVLVRDERTVYDEWIPVAQIDAAGQVVQRHLWGTDLSGSMQGADGVGGLLGTWDNGTTTRDGSEPGDGAARVWVCAYDGNGNVSAVIAATVAGGGATGNGGGAGTVRVARYDYGAFGKTLATWGDGAVAEANRYRFSTKPEDGTGLLYNGYRYLDTRLGRWVSRDPIGERGGINQYDASINSLSNAVDIFGLTQIYNGENPKFGVNVGIFIPKDKDTGKVNSSSRQIKDLIEPVRNKIRFCMGCQIKMHACNIPSAFSEALSKVAKCKVIFSMGSCAGLSPWASGVGDEPGGGESNGFWSTENGSPSGPIENFFQLN